MGEEIRGNTSSKTNGPGGVASSNPYDHLGYTGTLMKRWSSNEPLPEQLRWKMSFRDGTTYLEAESNSLPALIHILYLAWRRQHSFRGFLRSLKDLGYRDKS